jgi:alpha-amylase/alpha-mannosidase (GH57 family)
MLEPFPAYKRLYTLWKTVEESGEAGMAYLSGQYLADLVTWYHLAWTGETVRRARPDLLALMEKGEGFSLADRQALFAIYGEVIAGLLPRYREMAERGQIELSATPHSHPILPLLLDFSAAREARPDLPVPESRRLSGRRGARPAAHRGRHGGSPGPFRPPPAGFWPAEGGVSEAAVALLSEAGVTWTASGEGVLRHSLAALHQDLSHKAGWSTMPYRLPGTDTALFFRDDHLSDLIGFEYKGWFGADAVRHFIHALDEVRRHAPGPNPVVSIILDGENAWEYYPYNGFYFLSDLYAALMDAPHIRTTTFSDYLEMFPSRPGPCPAWWRAAGSTATSPPGWAIRPRTGAGTGWWRPSGPSMPPRPSARRRRNPCCAPARVPTGSGGSATTTRPMRWKASTGSTGRSSSACTKPSACPPPTTWIIRSARAAAVWKRAA